MAIKFKAIENLVVKSKNESTLECILKEYLTLRQKIESTDNQSWYFKLGLESSKQRLTTLNNEYEEIRKSFNESTIDCFIGKTNENSIIKSSYEGNYMGTIQLMHYSFIIGESKFLNELIRLKSKTELLMPIDYYSEKAEEFLIFLE